MPIDLIRVPPRSWEEYVSALKECDRQQRKKKFPVFDDMEEHKSWITTISTGRQIILTHGRWDEHDIAVLLGLTRGKEKWGLLGHMGARGAAKKTLSENQELVRKILHTLTDSSDNDFKETASKAIERLTNIKGFGIGIATRLITLARPDRAVSVNAAASSGFAKLYNGLPRTATALGSQKNYQTLLTRIYEQTWYQSPEPQDSTEQKIWSMRAALLDAFIYEPNEDDDAKQDYDDDATQEIERRTQLAKLRPGQQEFSRKVREIYRGKCAITGCKTPCALQAAHIRLSDGGDDNCLRNGILLRSDIHALFDKLLITLSEDGRRVEVSDDLTDTIYGFLNNAPVCQVEPKNLDHRVKT